VKIIDSLLANSQFVNLAKILVNSDKGTHKYVETYDALNALLISLGITVRMLIIKSDGGFWYSNLRKLDDPVLNDNFNTRSDIFIAINYAFGNPICNKKLYPLDLQSSVCSGYGFSTRQDSVRFVRAEYTAKTYKPTSSPLSTDVFTLRVIQDV
jgi:hypothetical protein